MQHLTTPFETYSLTTNSFGVYSQNLSQDQQYRVTLTIPSGYSLTTANNGQALLCPVTGLNFGIRSTVTPTPTPTPTPTLTPTATPTPIRCTSDTQCPGCQSCNTAIGLCFSNNNKCTSPNVCAGSVCAIPTPTPTLTPILPPGTTPTPTPIIPIGSSYSISGNIFLDTDKDGIKDAGEPPYTGAVTISLSNGGIRNNINGTYSFDNLTEGEYVVAFFAGSSLGLPDPYIFTYPPPLLGNALRVTVGTNCHVPEPGAPGQHGSCISGSISNLNAGVTNHSFSWFQSIGSDIRIDSGFSYNIPKDQFASIPNPVLGGMSGIIFSGKSGNGTSSSCCGQGQASASNWIVGSQSYPEVFTEGRTLIPTSYTFILETAQTSGITPTPITTTTLDSSVYNNHGIYIKQGNLDLTGSGITFGENQNFIILVNGDLTINERILVPIGSTVVFSVKGDITVNKAIGEQASLACNVLTHDNCTIEGLYSADGKFIAEGDRNCAAGADLRLNIAGSVIANAGRLGGSFVNKRDLCRSNSLYPSVTFTERPDFYLNYPSLTQIIPTAWREVAP